MAFLYHGKPEEMVGTSLIPLSKMIIERHDLYSKYLEKYKGREAVVERQIPLLECSWNDVVQLLPLHPLKLFELQQQLGLIDKIPDYQYFEIDPSKLDKNNTVVYFKSAPGDQFVTVKWLKDVDLDQLQGIPAETAAYYKSMVGTGEPVFNYQFVPHILYRGIIDISEARIIDLLT